MSTIERVLTLSRIEHKHAIYSFDGPPKPSGSVLGPTSEYITLGLETRRFKSIPKEISVVVQLEPDEKLSENPQPLLRKKLALLDFLRYHRVCGADEIHFGITTMLQAFNMWADLQIAMAEQDGTIQKKV